MSAEDRCYFCQGLPPLSGRRRRAGSAVRCPVCKGWLLRTSGQTYRDDVGPPDGECRPRRRLPLAAFALGSFVPLAAVGVLLVALAFHHTTPRMRPEGQPGTPVAVTHPAPSPAGETARPPEEAPAPPRAQPPAPARERPAVVKPGPAAKPVARKAVTAVRPPPAAPPTAAAPAAPSRSAPEEATPAQARDALPSWEDADTPEALAKVFRQVPELSLDSALAAGSGGKQGEARAKAAWQQLQRTVAEQREKFLDGLLAKRPDLAGLPLRKGGTCQLDLSAAHALDESSLVVRRVLASVIDPTTGRRRAQDSQFPEWPASITLRVYEGLVQGERLGTARGLPALEQILTGEEVPVRLAMVQYLRSPSAPAAATAALARRAVFDPSAEVRQAAVAGLHYRPAEEYMPTLLGGLRYPWPPANYHAADALAGLGAKGAVPDLVRVLDALDPRAPFEAEEGGRRVWAVRELVRLNHQRSCLLCHAPSSDGGGLVRAPVPSPLEPLPPILRYYSERGRAADGLFVRADVTYLRQDFSEVLPVEHPGPWPSHQRFDFLVRTRRLTEGEVQAWDGRQRLAGPAPLPPSRQAAVFALRQLTGLDGGFTADSWHEALAHAGRPVGPR